MFTINDDLSIYATRGDTVFFTVMAEEHGTPYYFEAGDVLRIKIFEKKNANKVVLEKCFPVTARTDRFTILLTEEDTKIGDVISKATDYWYEIELNPFTNPQTIIGYDEDGAKIFRLFPEGKDSEVVNPEPRVIAAVDNELDMTSTRPVQNQAIARAIVNIAAACKVTEQKVAKATTKSANDIAIERARIDNLVSGATVDDAELIDVRVGSDGKTYSSAGDSVRGQVKNVYDEISRVGKLSGIEQTEYASNTGKYISASGVISDGSKWAYTNPIEVFDGETVRFVAQGNEETVAMISLCNSDLTGITPVVRSSSNALQEYVYHVMNDGYITLSYYTGNVNRLYRTTDRSNNSLYERVVGVENRAIVTAEKVNAFKNKSLWLDKRFVAFGTSITWASADYAHDYLKIIKETCGFGSFVNLGKSGAGFANGTANGSGINSVVRNNEKNIASADLIILEGCTNDFKLNVRLGDINDIGAEFDSSNFTGALQDSIEFIYSANPKARILCICDPHRSNDGYTSFSTNTAGLKLTDYIARMIEVCEMYSISVLNWFAESGINLLNLSYYLKDGLHPNDNGYKLLGNITAKKVLELVPCDNGNTIVVNGSEYDISVAEGYDYKLVIQNDSATLLYYSKKPFTIWGTDASCYESFVKETCRATAVNGVFSENLVDFSAWEGLSATGYLNGESYYYATGAGARNISHFVWANHNVVDITSHDLRVEASEN